MTKKILVLTSRLPYPVIGGDKLRIYNVCKYLYESGFELVLLSFVENKNEAEIAKICKEKFIFSNVSTIILPKWMSYLNSLIGIFSKNPLQINYYLDFIFELSILLYSRLDALKLAIIPNFNFLTLRKIMQ